MVNGFEPRDRGFSLIEVVCAFTILSVLGLGLLHSGQQHANNIANAFTRTCAVRQCQSELERLRIVPTSQLVRGRTTWHPERIDGVEDPRGTVTVLPDGNPRDGLLSIEVAIEWRPRGATRPTRIALTTLRATEVRQ